MITVVDYKLNNLRSLENTLRRLGHDVLVTSNPEDVRAATKLILPGVGAFRDGMRNLHELGLARAIHRKSEVRNADAWESVSACICCSPRAKNSACIADWISFRAESSDFPQNLRVPHMGWNQLHFKQAERSDRTALPESSFVYFVHSYYAKPESADIVLATTDYEIEFPAIVHTNNIWATQFHPEKSQNVGEQLLDNFAQVAI